MEDSEPHARSGHPETNGSSEQQWPGQNEDLSSQNTFTFLRRTDGQASSPATPSDHPDDVDASSANGLDDEDRDSTPVSQPRIHPRFSRTFSMPQLGRLQNPHRRQNSKMRPNGASEPATPGSYQFYELSLELADMVQMAIQTLLQLSPPQVLDPTREQFSACALSVPTPSMSAMFTAMRNLNYFSANMAAFCTDDPPDLDSMDPSPLIAHTDFDLGELLQSVGDVMSGAAAAADVDLVLYHGDLSLKYAWVSGSESGITVALSHVRLDQ
jgi:osomolarity two-component system response regulator SSK1